MCLRKNLTLGMPILGVLLIFTTNLSYSFAVATNASSSRRLSIDQKYLAKKPLIPDSLIKKQEEQGPIGILKLNLKGDREALKKGFNSNQRSGTESGGGGSENRDKFYSVMRKAIRNLKGELWYKFRDTQAIQVSRFEDALRAVTVIPTHKQLYDLEGVPVDLMNDPDDLVIWFNSRSWEQMSEERKILLGFHELLGILEIPDPLYKYSEQLQLYVSRVSKEVRPKLEVMKQKIDRSTLIAKIQSSKTTKEKMVISLQCEKYDPRHQGFCLIESRIEDGIVQETIYLVDGTVEEFQKNTVPTVDIGLIRVLVNVPSGSLNFIKSVVYSDGGTVTVLDQEQCLNSHYANRENLFKDHFCIIAYFHAK